jgi:hypothetical protein
MSESRIAAENIDDEVGADLRTPPVGTADMGEDHKPGLASLRSHGSFTGTDPFAQDNRGNELAEQIFPKLFWLSAGIRGSA